jgi:hypothetical protein
MSALPVRLEGGLPPALARQNRAMLKHSPLPPLGAALLAHLDSRGQVRWLRTVAPASVVFDSAGGVDPATVEGMPLLTLDAAGNAYLFGHYRHAVAADEQRLEIGADDDMPDAHCYLASWNEAGALRWLRDIPGCDGKAIGLGVDGGRVVAITEHRALLHDAHSGRPLRHLALPAVQHARGGPSLHWTHAIPFAGRLVVGGVFRGKGELLGHELKAAQPTVVLATLSLDLDKGGE